MTRRLRIVLNIVLVTVIAAGVLVLARQQVRWRESAEAADRAARLVHAPADVEPEAPAEPPPAPAEPVPGPDTGSAETDPVVMELAELDLEAMGEVNPDVAGWLYIPDMDLSHPVLQGPDNDYYLHHTWEKKWNGGGSIFLDWRSDRTFEGFHTVLYGHRMRNGTMFGPLHQYKEQDFWEEHPYVYIADGTCVRRYAVFAAWEPSVTSAVYDPALEDEEERRAMIGECLGGSVIDTGVVPGPEDRLLTLSTCTGNGHETRWVVQAVLEETFPLQP